MQSNKGFITFFFDYIDPKTNNALKGKYYELHCQGDKYLKDYPLLRESLSFDYSHQSSLIQIVDFCTGIFYNALENRKESKNLYLKNLSNIVRHDERGSVLGWGICPVCPGENGSRFYQIVEEKISYLCLS